MVLDVDTYYVEVRAAPGSAAGGSYQLGVLIENPFGTPPNTAGPLAGDAEPNDSAAAATDLAGAWRLARHTPEVRGSFDGRDDVDVYAYRYRAGDLVAVRAIGFAAPPVMRVSDAQGNTLFVHGGDAGEPTSFIHTVRIPADGTYYVSLRPGAPDPDPNALYGLHALDTAPQSAPPGGAGVDYYRVPLSAGQRVTISAQPVKSAPATDGSREPVEVFKTSLRLESASGSLLAQAAAGLVSTIRDFVAPATAVYYVRVGGSPMVEYALVVVTDVGLETEPNDVRISPPLMKAGDVVGSLGPGDALDWLYFWAGPGVTETVTTFTPDGIAGPNLLDLTLEAYDTTGARIAADDNSAPDGRNARLSFTAPASGAYYLRVAPAAGGAGTGLYRLRVEHVSRVAGRRLFHNNSLFDSFTPGAGPDDDRAVAADKAALLPGQTPTDRNVTNSIHGITGIMLDLFRPTATALTAADFDVRVYDAAASRWRPAPVPDVSVRLLPAGDGNAGPDRVTLIFPAGSVTDTWLRVTTLPNERTGLKEPDVFYFGNLVAYTGRDDARSRGGGFVVTALDVARVRGKQFAASTPSDTRFDVNLDGLVERQDLLLVRQHLGRTLTPFADAPAPAVRPIRPPRRGVLEPLWH